MCLDLKSGLYSIIVCSKSKDIVDLKKYVGNQTGIMAKFEKPMAIKKMDEILKQCDAAMVARGDLGVEMPPEEVPIIQKELFNHAENTVFQLWLPLKCSIQWLTAPSPTRAEASDVATAVFDAADCLMLSAETASGKFP